MQALPRVLASCMAGRRIFVRVGCFRTGVSCPRFLGCLIPSILAVVFLSFCAAVSKFFMSQCTNSSTLTKVGVIVPVAYIVFKASIVLTAKSNTVVKREVKRGERRRTGRVFAFVAVILLMLSITFATIKVLFLGPVYVFLKDDRHLVRRIIPCTFIVFLKSIPVSFGLFFRCLIEASKESCVKVVVSLANLTFGVIFSCVFITVFKLKALKTT